ncbi:MAG: hypothetical protein Q8P84_06715 [Deltaproteobacteria bacterium]|nr:hypothetical protein [Deltaproteobacteria bacterium]
MDPFFWLREKEWAHLNFFSLGARVEEWRIWNRYEFKPDKKHPYKGKEVTRIALTRRVLRGHLHVWGPFAVFMDVGWQDAGVGYNRQKVTEPFRVNVDIDTQSPSSFLGPGGQMVFFGDEKTALVTNRFFESMIEGSSSFILTHREIRPNKLELDLGQGLKADFAGVADQYIKTDDVTYQMMYLELMWKTKYARWKFLQPSIGIGPNYMDIRSFIALQPDGEALLKKSGVKWGDVRKNLDFKKWAARYEAGLSSDLLCLGGMLYVLGQGYQFDPDVGADIPVKILATYKWAYIPETAEGRNRFRASNRTGGLELGYQF